MKTTIKKVTESKNTIDLTLDRALNTGQYPNLEEIEELEFQIKELSESIKELKTYITD